MLFVNVGLWDGSGCMTEEVFAQNFRALYWLSCLLTSDLFSFVEPDFAGTVCYPEGVKLVVAEFPFFFGSELGNRVRDFARRWGWVLAWGLGLNGRAVNFIVLPRAVDFVLFQWFFAGHNIMFPPSVVLDWVVLWAEVSKADRGALTPADWAGYWGRVPSPLHLSSGLRAGQCADADKCVGVAPGTGACVCYA